jgi:hypothetical protein
LNACTAVEQAQGGECARRPGVDGQAIAVLDDLVGPHPQQLEGLHDGAGRLEFDLRRVHAQFAKRGQIRRAHRSAHSNRLVARTGHERTQGLR